MRPPRAARPATAARPTTTRNHEPKAKAPKDRTLPLRTPFKLTGSAKDGDGDKLTYLWEQNDVGGAEGTKLVANKKVNGPLFRVFGTRAKVTNRGTLLSPSPNLNIANGNPTRYFPDLDQVLKGNTNARTGRCPNVPPPPDDLDDYVPPKGKVVGLLLGVPAGQGLHGPAERQGARRCTSGSPSATATRPAAASTPPTSPSSSTRAPGRSW